MKLIGYYSSNSSARVYHCANCRYVQRMNVLYKKKLCASKLKAMGYRPCKYCNTISFRLKREAGSLDKYCREKHMEYEKKSDFLYVRTEMGFWKLRYKADDQKFVLYHGNRSGKLATVEHPERELYHKQNDKPYAMTLMEAFIYINKHDQFRKAEKAVNGNIRRIRMEKRYREAAERRERRKKTRRLNYLFKVLETENEGFRELSYC